MYFPIPPYLRIFTSSFMPCMTDPAPKNMLALKKPWVSKCIIANAYPIGPKPVAKIMYPICDMVEAASAFLISSFAVPITAPNSNVITPTNMTTS